MFKPNFIPIAQVDASTKTKVIENIRNINS